MITLKPYRTGHFSTAFKLSDNKILLQSRDKVKECMAHGWFPESRMFPKIEFSDLKIVNFDNSENLYEMPFYEQPKSFKKTLSPRQWRLFKALRAVGVRLSCGFANYNRTLLEQLEGIPYEFRKERDALLEAVDALYNYSEKVGFEFSPRNLAVKGNKLILLDVFFLRDEIGHIYTRTKRQITVSK